MKRAPFARWFFSGLIIVALAHWIVMAHGKLALSPLRPNVLWILLSFCMHLFTTWLGSRGWLALLKWWELGGTSEFHLSGYWKSLSLYPMTGSLGSTMARYWFSRAESSSGSGLVVALLLEKVFVGSGAIVSYLFLAGIEKLPLYAHSLKSGFMGLLVVVLASLYAVNRQPDSILLQKWRLLLIYGLALPLSILLSLLLLARGFQVNEEVSSVLARSYLVGWIVGQATFVFPQGLGVREATFAWLLNGIVAPSFIVGYALWERMISTFAQGVFGLSPWINPKGAPFAGCQTPYADLFPGDAIFDKEARGIKGKRITTILESALTTEGLRKARLLDCGCGEGHMTEWFSAYVNHSWGADADSSMIERASERTKTSQRVQFVNARAEKLPFENNFFDVVICNQVYEHVEDPDKMMSEIHRVLKPGGICFLGARNRLGVFDGHFPIPTLAWWPRSLVNLGFQFTGHPEGYPVRLFTRGRLRKMVNQFEVEDYTVRVLDAPQNWGGSADMPGARLVPFIPRFVFSALYDLIPGYLWLLRPAGKTY